MPSLDALQADLDHVAAPWVKALGMRLVEVQDDGVVFTLPVGAPLVHGGGVVCGQALGGFKPMTTVQLSCSFLKAVPGDAAEVRVRCRLLRKGRNLAFGEIELTTPDGVLAAHATTTYAIL